MPFDAFLKIDGIEGESADDKHPNEIEVLSFSWGVSQPASGSASSGGGATAERCQHSDLSIVKTLDKASPKIYLACSDGTHIKEVILSLNRAGGDKVEYMRYTLKDVIISGARPGGSSGGGETLPLEEVSFNYGKIEWEYTQQKRTDGTGGGKVAGGWDLTKNKKI